MQCYLYVIAFDQEMNTVDCIFELSTFTPVHEYFKNDFESSCGET
ncbi:hypothetical protein T09_7762 [Trichinella sp. T9]|nr:hypothetical protein T09_7366 [Trichinella sp. T9]KRX39393.1 hypothetical protein T09_7762 [Trichinella sp. T9]